MNDEIANAIGLINNFLEEYVSKHNFNMSFDLYSNKGFNPTFKIEMPLNISSKELIKYSDDIFEKVGNFADLKNIDFILDDLSIILTRPMSNFCVGFDYLLTKIMIIK